MTRGELQGSLGGAFAAGVSPLAIPLPDPIKQALLATAAACLGWLTTLALNWLKKRVGGD
jgi:hypothetical protein